MKVRGVGVRRIVAVFWLCVIAGAPARGDDGAALRAAFDTIRTAELLVDSTLALEHATFDRPGLTLVFEKGRLAWLQPVTIDGRTRVFGAYFEGKGRLLFTAPLDVERSQIRRFFKADSLNRGFERILLLFSEDGYERLRSQATATDKRFKGKHRTRARDLLKALSKNDEYYFIFETLRALASTPEEPYLLVNVQPDRSPRLLYLLDPNRREEVTLWRHHNVPGESYMEQVCAFARDVTADRRGINGAYKSALASAHYDIEAAVTSLGHFRARARVGFTPGSTGGRLALLTLHPDLRVTSVTDGEGQPVVFLGHEDREDNWRSLYLFCDRPIGTGDTARFEFQYEGEITREVNGLFYVTAGAEWYPAPVDRKRSTFSLSFRTPRAYTFVASGEKIGEVPIADTLLTRWQVTRPTRNISFAIGPMERYDFDGDDTYSVEIYFSEQLHVNVGPSLQPSGRHMERQVGEDVLAALYMFDDQFGPYPYDRLRAAEILAYHGEAFPGFVQLGYPTWVQTDQAGMQKIFRAHEVAHQWWGVEVGYESYRDQWISEAFAEYSALLYLQATEGTGRMLDVLRHYRDDIFSVRKYLFGSGARAGAIALGYRAHTSETEGDYNLVVYKKGAFVLHMLRSLMVDLDTQSESRFSELLREFYMTYRGHDASTEEFKELAEKYYGDDLDWFFDQWVYGAQLPTYKLKSKVEQQEDGTWTVRGTIEPKDIDSTFRTLLPVVVELETGARLYRRYDISDQPYEFIIDGLAVRPEKVRLNPFEAVLAKIDD